MTRLSATEAKTAAAYVFDAFDADGDEVIEERELARVRPLRRLELEQLVSATDDAWLDRSFHSRDVPPAYVAGFAVAGSVAAASIVCAIVSIVFGFGILGVIALLALALSSSALGLLGADLGRERKTIPNKEDRRDEVVRAVVDLMRADARVHTHAALAQPHGTGGIRLSSGS